jgi:hypothetical protein
VWYNRCSGSRETFCLGREEEFHRPAAPENDTLLVVPFGFKTKYFKTMKAIVTNILEATKLLFFVFGSLRE